MRHATCSNEAGNLQVPDGTVGAPAWDGEAGFLASVSVSRAADMRAWPLTGSRACW